MTKVDLPGTKAGGRRSWWRWIVCLFLLTPILGVGYLAVFNPNKLYELGLETGSLDIERYCLKQLIKQERAAIPHIFRYVARSNELRSADSDLYVGTKIETCYDLGLATRVMNVRQVDSDFFVRQHWAPDYISCLADLGTLDKIGSKESIRRSGLSARLLLYCLYPAYENYVKLIVGANEEDRVKALPTLAKYEELITNVLFAREELNFGGEVSESLLALLILTRQAQSKKFPLRFLINFPDRFAGARARVLGTMPEVLREDEAVFCRMASGGNSDSSFHLYSFDEDAGEVTFATQMGERIRGLDTRGNTVFSNQIVKILNSIDKVDGVFDLIVDEASDEDLLFLGPAAWPHLESRLVKGAQDKCWFESYASRMVKLIQSIDGLSLCAAQLQSNPDIRTEFCLNEDQLNDARETLTRLRELCTSKIEVAINSIDATTGKAPHFYGKIAAKEIVSCSGYVLTEPARARIPRNISITLKDSSEYLIWLNSLCMANRDWTDLDHLIATKLLKTPLWEPDGVGCDDAESFFLFDSKKGKFAGEIEWTGLDFETEAPDSRSLIRSFLISKCVVLLHSRGQTAFANSLIADLESELEAESRAFLPKFLRKLVNHKERTSIRLTDYERRYLCILTMLPLEISSPGLAAKQQEVWSSQIQKLPVTQSVFDFIGGVILDSQLLDSQKASEILRLSNHSRCATKPFTIFAAQPSKLVNRLLASADSTVSANILRSQPILSPGLVSASQWRQVVKLRSK